MKIDELKPILEALIFASDEPLSVAKLEEFFEGTISQDEFLTTIQILNDDYATSQRSFEIIKVAGGYQMVTRPYFSEWVRKLLRTKINSKLSQPALETLAVIAFKQPIARHDIEAVRGVNVDTVLKTLLERNLISIKGRDPGPGRALLYGTTPLFLKYFGLNELSDLPKPKEIRELLKDNELPVDTDFLEMTPTELGLATEQLDREIQSREVPSDTRGNPPGTEVPGRESDEKLTPPAEGYPEGNHDTVE